MGGTEGLHRLGLRAAAVGVEGLGLQLLCQSDSRTLGATCDILAETGPVRRGRPFAPGQGAQHRIGQDTNKNSPPTHWYAEYTYKAAPAFLGEGLVIGRGGGRVETEASPWLGGKSPSLHGASRETLVVLLGQVEVLEALAAILLVPPLDLVQGLQLLGGRPASGVYGLMRNVRVCKPRTQTLNPRTVSKL